MAINDETRDEILQCDTNMKQQIYQHFVEWNL